MGKSFGSSENGHWKEAVISGAFDSGGTISLIPGGKPQEGASSRESGGLPLIGVGQGKLIYRT